MTADTVLVAEDAAVGTAFMGDKNGDNQRHAEIFPVIPCTVTYAQVMSYKGNGP
jgi:hypothetical protein